jgi:putative two-component system response regulator
MKEHTINGAFILSTYPNPMAREIALFHHERWDGKGYPYGVSETMIPLSGRVVAFADVYDALRMERSYKESFSHEKAIEIMTTEETGHFDPELMEVFLQVSENFRNIYESLRD